MTSALHRHRDAAAAEVMTSDGYAARMAVKSIDEAQAAWVTYADLQCNALTLADMPGEKTDDEARQECQIRHLALRFNELQ